MGKRVLNLVKAMGKPSRLFAYIGALALMVMMFMTATDVIGRYVFNSPIIGVFEITQFLVLLVIFSFLAYSQAEKAHVAVDLLVDRFPARVQKWVKLFNYVLCLVVMGLITWMSIVKAIDMKAVGEASTNLRIPTYPFVWFLVLGCAIMCLEYVRDIIMLFSGKK